MGNMGRPGALIVGGKELGPVRGEGMSLGGGGGCGGCGGRWRRWAQSTGARGEAYGERQIKSWEPGSVFPDARARGAGRVCGAASGRATNTQGGGRAARGMLAGRQAPARATHALRSEAPAPPTHAPPTSSRAARARRDENPEQGMLSVCLGVLLRVHRRVLTAMAAPPITLPSGEVVYQNWDVRHALAEERQQVCAGCACARVCLCVGGRWGEGLACMHRRVRAKARRGWCVCAGLVRGRAAKGVRRRAGPVRAC